MSICCPDECRLRASTKAGERVDDLHRHHDMLKGHLASQGPSQATFWHDNGRLTALAETTHDLVFIQDEDWGA